MVRKLWCTILLGLAIASQPLFAQDTTLVPLGFAIDEPFVFARLSPQYIYISGSMELLLSLIHI
jgi:hypothetical protein